VFRPFFVNELIIKINYMKPNYFSWPKSMRILLGNFRPFAYEFFKMTVFIIKNIIVWFAYISWKGTQVRNFSCIAANIFVYNKLISLFTIWVGFNFTFNNIFKKRPYCLKFSFLGSFICIRIIIIYYLF